jgi:hypothetical protein
MATVNLGKIKPTWRNAWASGTAYTVDDMVSHGGTSYMCISNVTGTTTPNSDTSNWDTMAGKGDIGVTGAQGTTGNTGSQGPIGNTGPSGFPSGGTAGQVVTNTSSGIGTWQDVAAGGKVLKVTSAFKSSTRAYYGNNRGVIIPSENFVGPSGSNTGIAFTKVSSTSIIIIDYTMSACDFFQCHSGAIWRTTGGSPTTGVSNFQRIGFDGSRVIGSAANSIIISGQQLFTSLSSGSHQFWWGLGRSNDGATTGYRVNPNTTDHNDTSGAPTSQITVYEIEV